MLRMRAAVAVVAVVGATLLGFVGALPGAQAQDQGPILGGRYEGTFQDTSGLCSGGALTLGEEFGLTVGEYERSIVSLHGSGFSLGNAFPSPTSFSYLVHIPVADDGSFNGDFSALDIVHVHIEGRFEGERVSGSVRIDVSGTVECEGDFTAQGTAPEAVEETFEVRVQDQGGGCGGGTISVTRSADRRSVVRISVDGVGAGDTRAYGSATFDEGTLPISASDGSFAYAYFPGREASQEISVSGTFSMGDLTGAVSVSPSSCGSMSYGVSTGGFGGGDAALPNVGGGVPSGSGVPSLLWAAAMGVVGVLALGAGLAARRRDL